jgi:hypothetical protein
MDRETMAINAPVIGIVCGEAHLQAVRDAFKAHRTMEPSRHGDRKTN